MDRLEVLREDEGDDGHELHEDVEGRAGGVLERVTHGVANHGRLKNVTDDDKKTKQIEHQVNTEKAEREKTQVKSNEQKLRYFDYYQAHRETP